jgi:hypothetical protein
VDVLRFLQFISQGRRVVLDGIGILNKNLAEGVGLQFFSIVSGIRDRIRKVSLCRYHEGILTINDRARMSCERG